MELEIVTPDEILYQGKVSLIQVPGSKGLFQVLQYHAPIISTLEKGKIKVEEWGGAPQYFEIEGGVIEVRKNITVILAEVA